ncbi:MAG: hypothetical protein FDZ69_02245 [Deltaproteobacteria bacterium]|nr:MAG: hypothetical protein FDZ69_02245 [Deltaproteobacteria bacterium]
MPRRHRRSLFLALLVSLLLICAGCSRQAAPPGVAAGILSGDTVWAGTVFVGGDVTVARGASLTIAPGTVVRFLTPDSAAGGRADHPHFPGSELNVEGTLVAVGSAGEPITFAAADDAAPAGSWGALNFAEGAAGTLRYCVFRQADSAVHSREATVEIAESVFENNLVGIRFNSSAIRIERNLLRGNGTAVRFHFGAPVVRGNRFESNRVNLFVTAHPRDYRFEGNFFGRPEDYQVVLGEEVPENVHLAGNNWDGGAAAAVLGQIFDGRRSPYLGIVEIEPVATLPANATGPSWMQ